MINTSTDRRPAAVAFAVSLALSLVGCAAAPAPEFWTGFRDHPHGYLARDGGR